MHAIGETTGLATMLAGLIAPWLQSPASIVVRRVITLIMCLGTSYTIISSTVWLILISRTMSDSVSFNMPILCTSSQALLLTSFIYSFSPFSTMETHE